MPLFINSCFRLNSFIAILISYTGKRLHKLILLKPRLVLYFFLNNSFLVIRISVTESVIVISQASSGSYAAFPIFLKIRIPNVAIRHATTANSKVVVR